MIAENQQQPAMSVEMIRYCFHFLRMKQVILHNSDLYKLLSIKRH